MREKTFQDVLAAGGAGSTPASPNFLLWLGTVKAPSEVIASFAAGVAREQKSRLWKQWELYSESQIREEAYRFPRYVKAGLLAVGSCINGDPIAVDIRKQIGTVGFISHDVVWEDDEAPIRKHFTVVAPSLLDFVRGARDGEIPIDYWAAKRAKEGRRRGA